MIFADLRAAVILLRTLRERYTQECYGIGGMDLFRMRGSDPGRPAENAAIALAALSERITEQEARVRDLRRQAEALLSGLPPLQAQVIRLRCSGKSWREVAQEAGFADKRSAIRAYKEATKKAAP